MIVRRRLREYMQSEGGIAMRFISICPDIDPSNGLTQKLPAECLIPFVEQGAEL